MKSPHYIVCMCVHIAHGIRLHKRKGNELCETKIEIMLVVALAYNETKYVVSRRFKMSQIQHSNSSNFCPLLISIKVLFTFDNSFWGDRKIIFKSEK